MTSQVAIINQRSVCLASDSAVTYSPTTVFNSAEKIYQLAGRQPVGYMIYAAGGFMGHSWDRIFGMYRRKIADDAEINGSKKEQKWGRAEFDYLCLDVREDEEEKDEGASDYVGHILHFLADCDALRDNEEIASVSMADEIFAYMKANVPALDMIDNAMRNTEYHPALAKEGTAFFAAMADLVENQISYFAEREYNRVTEGDDELVKLIEENQSDINPIAPLLAHKLSTVIRRELTDIGDLLMICTCYLHSISENPMFAHLETRNYSALVMGGFGKKEAAPDLVEIIIRPKWNGMRYSVEHKERPSIIPLAQSERIQAVVQSMGIHTQTQLMESISNELQHGFIPFLAKNTPGIGEKTLKLMQELVTENKWSFSAETIKNVRDKRAGRDEIGPYEVDRLSPLDMASLAEKLVDMEATFQYVTQATGAGVGGSIDVVTITKEDGLVWIKRKDVIDANLNPRIYRTPRPEGRHI